MQQFEIFDGNCYRFTVSPSENPMDVLEEERRNTRNPMLRMVMVEDGVRTEVEGPRMPEAPEFDLDDNQFEGWNNEA